MRNLLTKIPRENHEGIIHSFLAFTRDCMMLYSLGECFSNIERGERHKYICLKKGDEKFEKPEWQRDNLKGASMK